MPDSLGPTTPNRGSASLTQLGFRVQGLGFKVQGLGLRVQGLGFRVSGLGLRLQVRTPAERQKATRRH